MLFLISTFWLTNFTVVIPIEIIHGQKLLSQIWQSELMILLIFSLPSAK